MFYIKITLSQPFLIFVTAGNNLTKSIPTKFYLNRNLKLLDLGRRINHENWKIDFVSLLFIWIFIAFCDIKGNNSLTGKITSFSKEGEEQETDETENLPCPSILHLFDKFRKRFKSNRRSELEILSLREYSYLLFTHFSTLLLKSVLFRWK